MSDASTEYEESLLDSSDDDDMDWLAEQIYRVDDETLDRESRAEAFLANLKKEVSKKHLQGELRRKFDEADLSEWRSIVEKDVVRLLTEIEAARVYKIEPERVMGSRFVRTRKELDIEEINMLPEGSISWKAKSRWVVQGYTEPDADGMQSSSPVSSTRSLYLTLQKAANKKWKTLFADVKTAYLNQPTRKREQGAVYVKLPRDHPELPGRLCELQKDSYGVICGALRWYQTFRNFLLGKMKLTASKTDESMYLLKKGNKLHGIVCVVVDDLCMVGHDLAMKEF